jgi:hypothetical protein
MRLKTTLALKSSHPLGFSEYLQVEKLQQHYRGLGEAEAVG